MVEQPTVCHVVASINEDTGGPALSVTSLAKALSRRGISSHLVTIDYRDLGNQVSVPGVELHSSEARFVAKNLRGMQGNARKVLAKLAASEVDLIHGHGMWMFPNLYARKSAVKNGIPLVVSPRGMLDSWSLQRSWFKKRIAWQLYEEKNLRNARLFHATSEQELASIRGLGFTQPVALIGNGVFLPPTDGGSQRDLLRESFPKLPDKRFLLFLSRIHPKKGLDALLHAWNRIVRQFPEWHLILAGPDLIGYRQELEGFIAREDLAGTVTFTGMLRGRMKEAALRSADLFVLPTHSENFGIVVAEALSYGLPVVTTKQSPWRDVATHGCGWWVEDNEESLALALIEGMNMSSEELKQLGLSGRALIETKHSWELVAKEMASVYTWILGGGTAPECVHFS